MCILFILVGSCIEPELRPTIIASNRDEYFTRATNLGTVSIQHDSQGVSVYRYLPTDLEDGGSWLGFDVPTDTKDNLSSFRFAVVLNFHSWRSELLESGTHVMQKAAAPDLLLSRGMLVKNYLTNGLSAKEYAESLASSINRYRPFNLIVGDASEVYFLATHQPQPILLRKGFLYGLTNGHQLLEYNSGDIGAFCGWEKLHRGCRLVDQKILPFLPLVEEMARSEKLWHLRYMARTVCEEVLNDSTPLPDASFGSESAAACQLAAIFVKPIKIARQPILAVAGSSGVDTLEKSSDQDSSAKKRQEELKKSVLSSFEVIGDGRELDFTNKALFGTRTSTSFVYMSDTSSSEPIFALADRNFDAIAKKWELRVMGIPWT